MNSETAPAQKSNRNIIIAVVVGAVVLCCCCLAIAVVALSWSCGDLLMGAATQCAPLFP